MAPAAPAARGEQLAAAVAEVGLDALIVGDLVHPGDSGRDAIADLTWLTGFTGTSGLAVVGAGQRLFITDFRYMDRAAAGLPDGFELLRAESRLPVALGSRLHGRVGFDPAATSVRERERLEELIAGSEANVELVEIEGLVEPLRRRKDEAEIAAVAAASELTDTVYEELESTGFGGRTERQVALWIEQRMKELGASAVAFAPIVASGPNGALPHHEPGERPIERGDLVVTDIGAILDGYCSDGTRTYAVGSLDEVEEEARDAYDVVWKAQEAALAAIAAGEHGRRIDAVARELIAERGYGQYFGHGLGHGVGIAVHEAPRLSQRSEDELLAGDVVTVEPGVYLPGRFGIRIEDLVVVTDDGIRNLSTRPKQLIALS